MREEFFRKLKARLGMLCVNAAGEYYMLPEDADAIDGGLHEHEIGRASCRERVFRAV